MLLREYAPMTRIDELALLEEMRYPSRTACGCTPCCRATGSWIAQLRTNRVPCHPRRQATHASTSLPQDTGHAAVPNGLKELAVSAKAPAVFFGNAQCAASVARRTFRALNAMSNRSRRRRRR